VALGFDLFRGEEIGFTKARETKGLKATEAQRETPLRSLHVGRGKVERIED
jgi:hypothetical protein